MNVGFFGGSFNPIHNAHIAVARQVLRQTALDEVWFMVSPHNPFKEKSGIMDDALRLDMVRAALRDEHGLVCSDYEFRLPRPSYTWNTLRSLAKDFPENTFTLLIGADNWARFGDWNHAQDILDHHDIMIYPRRGHPVGASSLPPNVRYVDMPYYDLNATMIRRRLDRNEDVSDLMPPQALEILLAKGGRP